MKKQLDDLLARKIVRRSNSAFAASSLFVKKADTLDLRWCFDYRPLNLITVKTVHRCLEQISC